MIASAGYEAAGELLRALASPLRIAIVTELGSSARCVHELVDTLHAPQPLVSQHLRVLRGAGVVSGARRGREIVYSLTDQHIAHIVADAISHAGEPRPGEPADRAGLDPEAADAPDPGNPGAAGPDARTPVPETSGSAEP
jgi:DNA-binding transcriptional ArsR family regulator